MLRSSVRVDADRIRGTGRRRRGGEGTCTSKAVHLLVRWHIVAGEFYYIGKEASTRWASGVDLSMLAEAGALYPPDEICREYETVIDTEYLDQIRTEAKQFSNKLLSRRPNAIYPSDSTVARHESRSWYCRSHLAEALAPLPAAKDS